MSIKDVSEYRALIKEVNSTIQKLKDQKISSSVKKKLKRELLTIRAGFQHLKDMLDNIIITINKALVKYGDLDDRINSHSKGGT